MGVSYTSRLGFVVGLDLGQANDFTAITVIDRVRDVVEDQPQPIRHEVPHLQRFKLGTPYPDQVAAVRKLMAALPARTSPPMLIVDGTGVGRPIVDMLRNAGLAPVAVTITSGLSETDHGDFRYGVPKRSLVSCLQSVMQSGRLKIAPELPEAQTLVNELLNFKVKISQTGHDSYEAWRESVHDDLVLSAALAVYWSERKISDRPRAFRHNLFER